MARYGLFGDSYIKRLTDSAMAILMSLVLPSSGIEVVCNATDSDEARKMPIKTGPCSLNSVRPKLSKNMEP